MRRYVANAKQVKKPMCPSIKTDILAFLIDSPVGGNSREV